MYLKTKVLVNFERPFARLLEVYVILTVSFRRSFQRILVPLVISDKPFK